MPPSHGPTALATLKALWFSAAASVCASPATSISRVCNTELSPPPQPTRKTTSVMDHRWEVAIGYSASEAALHSSRPPAARIWKRSAAQPPNRLPTVSPTPKTPSTAGMTSALTPVTASSVEAR
ncbi:hypothetical protein COSO111634_34255 [Corallococcus soli]